MEDQGNTTELAKLLAPFLAMTALAAVIATLLLIRFLPSTNGVDGSVAVVTFDVVKYTNAQRAVASTFLNPRGEVAQANELLLDLSKRTREAIQDVAGPGTLVVVHQVVVQGHARDITDDVLKKLGLPTDVPTADATRYALDVAPTMVLSPPPKLNLPMVPGEGKDPTGKVLP